MSPIFFCSSYAAVGKLLETLSCLEPPEQITLICSDPGVDAFLRSTVSSLPFHCEIISFTRAAKHLARDRPWRLLWERKNQAREFSRHFADLQGRDIYFFDTLYLESWLWMVQRLRKRNQIFIRPTAPDIRALDRRRWTEFKMRWIFGLKDVEFTEFHEMLCSIPTPNYFKNNGIRLFDQPADPARFQALLSRLLPPEALPIEALVLLDGHLECDYMNSAQYTETVNAVLRILEKRFRGSSIAVKRHPRSPQNVEGTEGYILPTLSAFPAEILLHPQLKLLIGTATSAFLLKRQDLPQLRFVSLIDLVYLDGPRKSAQRAQLSKRAPWVAIPQSLAELENLITFPEAR